LWISGLHIPETYLAALVQIACRLNNWPLDRSTLYTNVSEYVDPNDVTLRPPAVRLFFFFDNSIPGHFFNSEHSPYLFPMFNFKKHRSMHCELLCNQLHIPNTRDFEIMLKIVPIDGIGLSCVALEMSRTFLML
jgi:hypothetical protein